MLVINDIEINEDTFKDLLNIVKGMKKNLEEGNIGNVKFKLDVLEARLEYNLLKEDK